MVDSVQSFLPVGVVVFAFNRPAAKNAMSLNLMKEVRVVRRYCPGSAWLRDSSCVGY